MKYSSYLGFLDHSCYTLKMTLGGRYEDCQTCFPVAHSIASIDFVFPTPEDPIIEGETLCLQKPIGKSRVVE
jgi:hypothetical protein